MTSLSNRFEGLSITYIPYRVRPYHVNYVALSFINAMKLGALEDCDERLTSYTYTDAEYQDSEIRIQVTAVNEAPQEQLVRCNVLYAIKTIAIDQINFASDLGLSFTESRNGILLYRGILDNKHDGPSLQRSSNSSADLSVTDSREKRELSAQVLNTTKSATTLLNVTGSNDFEYEIYFYFTGTFIDKISIFSAILDFMMTLAQRDGNAPVDHVSQATSADPYWIFVMHVGDSSFSLQVYEILAILEGIAQYCVSRRHYRELSFRFFVNREYTAHGCLTDPIPSRRWCQGMR